MVRPLFCVITCMPLALMHLMLSKAVAAELEPADWGHCGVWPTAQNLRDVEDSIDRNSPTIYMFADKVTVDRQENFNLFGNVLVSKEKASLTADNANYQSSHSMVDAEGNVRFEFENLLVSGNKARFDLNAQAGDVQQSQIWLLDKHIRAEAHNIKLHGKEMLELDDASLTSCDEGKYDWRLRASELKLNRGTNTGTAKHARFELYKVPVFYFPYLSYPLSGRKSGFLIPHIGSSSTSGFEVSIPYYVNIAPRFDATFTPRYFSRRGIQLQNEFRYLNRRNHGQINYDILPNDRKTDEDLSFLVYRHDGNPFAGWATHIDYNYVSNNDYFKDFGNDLGLASTSFLNRQVDVAYAGSQLNFSTRLQNFQTIDESVAASNIPYERLPQFLFSTNELALAKYVNFKFDSEAVRFDRDLGVVGTRMDLYPQFTMPFNHVAGFIIPKVGLRYTQYQLEHNAANTDSSPNRSVPIASLDSGLFFERDAKLQRRGFMQTLEPRLFYLYVPYRDQDSLIVDENGRRQTFDSDLMQFNLLSLFNENRFSGRDLVGDANQLSLSLTSRLFDDVGQERLQATIGQLFYFQSRKVTAPGGAEQTGYTSDTILEFSSRWNRHISTNFNIRWDTTASEIGQGGLRVRYEHDKDRIVNFNYRYEREQIDQVEMLAAWPFHRNWKPVVYWRYSILDARTLENYAGIQYDSCCLAFRLVRKDYIQDIEDRNISVLFELELKGLSSVGNEAKKLFGQNP